MTTPPFDAHEIFYDNFLDANSRLLEIEEFAGYMSRYLENEAEYVRNAHVDLEIEFLPLFAGTFPPILHSSLIISTAIVLELEMKGYADTLRKARDFQLGVGDLSGSMLERFRGYVAKLAQVPVHWDNARWPDVVGVFEIRNCLVHAGGNLKDFGKANVIRAFAGRHGTPDCMDDRMAVDGSTSSLVLDVASAFIEEIYEGALRAFPGRNRILKTRPSPSA